MSVLMEEAEQLGEMEEEEQLCQTVLFLVKSIEKGIGHMKEPLVIRD